MIKCLTTPDRIGIWKCWFLRRGENRSTRRKTSRSKEENQQQTQPTYDAGSGNWTWDTLVGGERSHRCAIPATVVVVDENKNASSSTSKHFLLKHFYVPKKLNKIFSIWRKCRNMFDCLIYEMIFNGDLRPGLNCTVKLNSSESL